MKTKSTVSISADDFAYEVGIWRSKGHKAGDGLILIEELDAEEHPTLVGLADGYAVGCTSYVNPHEIVFASEPKPTQAEAWQAAGQALDDHKKIIADIVKQRQETMEQANGS